jgi:CheY-like chemotaxis protein
MALDILTAGQYEFSAVLLDRMMPGINGIDVVKRMKLEPDLANLPIIMQTAMASKDSMIEGLEAGAHYYLAKPYDRETLATIVKAAVSDFIRQSELHARIRATENTLTMMESGQFKYRTVDEGKALATMLANASDDPDKVVVGLTELMINAVEHGNLEITYDDKSSLNEDGLWLSEIERRLELPQYRQRTVSVDFIRNDDEFIYKITDQGEGFDWEKYIEISPDRAFDTHGRGIAMAKMISFSNVEFLGKGNEIRATQPRKGE